MASSSPLSTIPNELLLETFLICFHQLQSNLERARFPETLRLVSHRFSLLTLSCGHLWSQILITSHTRSSKLSERLSRAGSSLLRLEFALSEEEEEKEWEGEEEEETTNRIPSNSKILASVLRPTTDRWRVLHVTGHPNTAEDMFAELELNSFTSLQEISVDSSYWEVYELPGYLLHDDIQVLKSINCGFRWLSPLPHHLRELCIEETHNSPIISIKDMAAALMQVPDLTTLSLANVQLLEVDGEEIPETSYVAESRCIMLKLENLSLISSRFSDSGVIFSNIVASNLRFLQLSFDPDEAELFDEEEVVDICGEAWKRLSFPKLERFKLGEIGSFRPLLLDFLAKMPSSMECLIIDNPSNLDQYIGLLRHPRLSGFRSQLLHVATIGVDLRTLVIKMENYFMNIVTLEVDYFCEEATIALARRKLRGDAVVKGSILK